MSWLYKKTKWETIACGEEMQIGYARTRGGMGDQDKAYITFDLSYGGNMMDYKDGIECDTTHLSHWDRHTDDNHTKLTIRVAGQEERRAIYEGLKCLVDEMEKDLAERNGKCPTKVK